MGDFQKCLTVVLAEEGGNDDDPHDPGGRTSRGIEQREYDAWCDLHARPRGDVWKAAQADIVAIYRENYWLPISGDTLPAGVDLAIFDSAVNSGVGQTALWVQRSTGVRADGHFGPITLKAVIDDRNNGALIASILDKRLVMDQGLVGWTRYGKDWGGRIDRVKATSQSWASGDHDAVHPNVEFSAPRARVEDLRAPIAPIEAPHTVTLFGTLVGIGATVLHEVSGSAKVIADTLQPAADIAPVIGKICIGLTVAGALAGLILSMQHRRYQARVDGSAGG